MNNIDDFNFTDSPYVNNKYKEFYEEHGYLPEMFNPYNKTEITDFAPTLTAQGDSMTKSGTVLIIDDLYANREIRVYEDYAPTLRSERSGLKVVEERISNE